MRTLPAGLADHIEGQATTLCSAWRMTRRDGTVLGFTDHDHDLAFAGTVFRAASGFAASDIESGLGLNVDTAEIAGALSGAAITDKDLNDGRYDGARIEMFAVNWAEPGEHVLMHVHDLGEVARAGNAFRAELRTLAHRLDQVQGRVYGRRCDADLGDGRCGVDLDDPAYHGAGLVLAGATRMEAGVSGLQAFASGWFRFGLLTWTTGANAGLRVDIHDHRLEEGAVRLGFWSPLANVPQEGDAFTVTAGCAKTFAACREKFANQLNFQGFPHLPGSDFAYGYADGETVHDGRPLVS